MIIRLYYVLMVVVLTLLFSACNIQVLSQGVIPVELQDGDQYDFTAIGAAVKDKRVVALGESSHGVGDYYSFKAALVQYLHEYHGFEVLAFEAGLGDLNLAYSALDTLSAVQLLNQTLFSNFRCEEVEPLFHYMKSVHVSERPLIYSGFDNQFSASFFQHTIQPAISEYDAHLGAELEFALDGYVRWFRAGYYQDSIKYVAEAKAFTNTAERIQSVFSKNKKAIQLKYKMSDLDFRFIEQACLGFKRTVDLPYEERHRGSAHRDHIMFDNIQWLMNEIYPDRKVIIWAHNAHIEQRPMFENSFKWMGHYLHDQYGDDYYALGLFAQTGEAYQQWGDTIIALNNTDTTMLESIMMASGHRTSFLDIEQVDKDDIPLSWIYKRVDAFENEKGGRVSFVPKDRFDGIVVMRAVKAPSY